MLKSLKIILSFLLVGSVMSCGSETNYSPKPKGYNRLDLPAHAYKKMEEKHPYSFEYSKHAKMELDSSAQAEPHWLIVRYPDLGAMIQFTYKPLNDDLAKLTKHVDDAYKLAGKHHVKADAQEEKIIKLKNGKKAMVIELYGEVPSHYQFYVTDTSQHFLRGALYLNQVSLNDSLTPLIDYLKADCEHILETLTWQ